jgi:hypothetical protein
VRQQIIELKQEKARMTGLSLRMIYRFAALDQFA